MKFIACQTKNVYDSTTRKLYKGMNNKYTSYKLHVVPCLKGFEIATVHTAIVTTLRTHAGI